MTSQSKRSTCNAKRVNWHGVIAKALGIAEAVIEGDEKCEKLPEVRKGARDYSTAVDLKVERVVKNFLKIETPDIPVIGEESSPRFGKLELAWVPDPVDGTVNYSQGRPLHGVSVALIDPRSPRVAGVSLPALGRRYLAELGAGAYMNGTRVRVSGTVRLSEAVVSIGDFPTGKKSVEREARQIKILGRLARRVLRVRMHGAAAVDMCFVADGTVEAAITLSNRIWDIQPGVLIVRGAGSIVVEQARSHHTVRSATTVATTKKLKDSLMRAVSGA